MVENRREEEEKIVGVSVVNKRKEGREGGRRSAVSYSLTSIVIFR
jgi:hypothetical protein